MSTDSSSQSASAQSQAHVAHTNKLARLVLAAFLFTFLMARILVFLIMSNKAPDMFLHVGGTHVHHLNYGIFLLSVVCAYLIFVRPLGVGLSIAAVVYGIALGLTFDEFGMWLHLGGSYWQRSSYDAVVVIAALLALIGFAAQIKKFRPHHLLTSILMLAVLGGFSFLMARSARYFHEKITPSLMNLEEQGPK